MAETVMGPGVSFYCSIPMLQSALTVAGDGGGRLKLDFDDSQINEVLRMLAWRGELLEVTVRPVVQNKAKHEDADEAVATRSIRKSCWQAPEVQGPDRDSGAGW